MSDNRFPHVIQKKLEHSRRQFLGDAMAAVAAGALLQTTATFAAETPATKAKLFIGAAAVDITPSEPVALDGQMLVRISRKVESPVTANVVAMELRNGEQSLETTVMVSCDLAVISKDLLELVREAARKRLPNLGALKIMLNATHSHTAPVTRPGRYDLPKTGFMQPEAYLKFAAERIAGAIERAWNGRGPGSVSWGLGHAVVAQNRRAVYANGHAQLYGKTNRPDFRGLEGYEDHDINTLFFWDEAGKLAAIVVNVSCPSQEVESGPNVNADFWHQVREALHKRHGANVCVLGWTGAAGDQSPHTIYRKAAEDRMTKLRGLTRLQEIARRIDLAVNETYEAVKNDRHADVPLIHRVENITLPVQLVTETEYKAAKKAVEEQEAAIRKAPTATDGRAKRLRQFYGRTVERYEEQKNNPHPTYDMELHVLRIGDVAICTNEFELFTDYGIQIKARSEAIQTFVVQLAGPGGYYLPTERAVRGGSYSAIIESILVGPEGGQILVDRTVELIHSMWAKS